jgi:hypothetical protein
MTILARPPNSFCPDFSGLKFPGLWKQTRQWKWSDLVLTTFGCILIQRSPRAGKYKSLGRITATSVRALSLSGSQHHLGTPRVLRGQYTLSTKQKWKELECAFCQPPALEPFNKQWLTRTTNWNESSTRPYHHTMVLRLSVGKRPPHNETRSCNYFYHSILSTA